MKLEFQHTWSSRTIIVRDSFRLLSGTSSPDARTSSMSRVALKACMMFVSNMPKFTLVSTYRVRLEFLNCDGRWLYFGLVMFFEVAVSGFPPLLARTIKLKSEFVHQQRCCTKSLRFYNPHFWHQSFMHSFTYLTIFT